MSPVSILLLALGMSVDSLLAAVGHGASLRRPALGDVLRTGIVFGAAQMLTPLIGWAAGVAASAWVAPVDHWIAFGLLAAVGGRMIFLALSRPAGEAAGPAPIAPGLLVATAIGTSIDAMAVGVSLAFLEVNIVVVAAVIGFVTFLMSAGGVVMGRLVCDRCGRHAEVMAGALLVGLGLLILAEHLGG